MRLIDADVFRRELDNHFPFTKEEQSRHGIADIAKSTVLFVLNKTPIVDAVPVAHGWWKAVTEDMVTYKRICSCCGEEAPFDESEDVYLLYPHCPWCGALLDIKGGNGNG